MKNIILFTSFMITSCISSDIEEIKKSMMMNYIEQSQNIKIHNIDNEKLIKQNSVYYMKIVQEATKYYEGYIGKTWGEDNIKLSSNKNFTKYSDDLKSRENIDFKEGKLEIEILTDLNEKIKINTFQNKLDDILKEDTVSLSKKDPIEKLSNKYLAKKKIINKFEVDNDIKIPLKDLISKAKLKTKDIKKKIVKLKNGTEKKILSVEIKMVPEHLKKRAIIFKDYVYKYAKKYNIDPSYIFATIQTESYFNPLARSHIPAYGLMQIVPATAGIDAYKALTGKTVLLPSNYLYDAKNNIELGIKYIQIIKEKYLKGIKNQKSLDYCTATSYNAGIGNLIKSFTGSFKDRKQAINIINSMTPSEVYNHLTTSKSLTSEAKNYVTKITNNSKNYLNWDI